MPGEVLVVLPDARLRALVAAQLQEEGYQVVAVPDFTAARRRLSRGVRPRVVVADLAVAEDVELSALARSGVAVLTVGGQVDRSRAAQLGLPHLSRPFTVGQLAERLRGLVGDPDGPEGR